MATLTALVIDDSAPILAAHSKMLETLGYDVVQAENGRQGLDILRESRFSVVLSDIEMPIMDGLEMITTLRQLEAEQDVDSPQLVICVTGGHSGHGDTETVAREAGMDAFVKKPMKLSVLKERLAEHV